MFLTTTAIPHVQGMEFLGPTGIASYKLFFHVNVAVIVRLLAAIIAGGLIGWTHIRVHRDNVGFRTYAAVCMAAAGFTSMSAFLYLVTGADAPLNDIAAIADGVGFISGAVIYKDLKRIRGLSTGATLWATASVGAAIGLGMLLIGLTVTVFLIIFHLLPRRILHVVSEE
jgi:putative Mg2+ transporter-C (MgtC) family protein